MESHSVSDEKFFCYESRAVVGLTIRCLRVGEHNLVTRVECDHPCEMLKETDRYGLPLKWRQCPACVKFLGNTR